MDVRRRDRLTDKKTWCSGVTHRKMVENVAGKVEEAN